MPPLLLTFRRAGLGFPGMLCSVVVGLSGCGGAEPQAPRELAKARTAWTLAQNAACLRPAVSSECEPGYQLTFGSARHIGEKDRIAGSLWCEKGQAFGHFEGPAGDVTAPVAPVVWEAVWRVLTQTEDCAEMRGAAVFVTRRGIAHPCKAPRFAIDSLLNNAYFTARTGPPKRPAAASDEPESGEGLSSICDIDPNACRRVDPRDPCPPFSADPWNGIVAKAASSAEVAGAAAPEPATDQAPPENRRRPPYAAVTGATDAELPRARQCLPANADVSRATLTFRSDGTVQSVAVSGWVAGKPASGCVVKALSLVRVPSFLDPTFAITVTVRP